MKTGTKTFPEVVIDRQERTVALDGEDLPYFLAEEGPRVEELGEGLSVLWLPIIVGDVEDIPAPPSRGRPTTRWTAIRQEVLARGGRCLESYRGDS